MKFSFLKKDVKTVKKKEYSWVWCQSIPKDA